MMQAQSLSARKRLLLQKQLAGAARLPRRAIPRRRADETAPVSAEQKDVWLHASMAPDIPLYNEALTIHRRGPFDRGALERTIRAVVRRHEIWRTSFRVVDGNLRQIVEPDLHIDIPFDDLASLPEADRDTAARDIATADARQLFDLARAPLLRARIVRIGPYDHRLYLTLHHIVFDGVSIYRVVVPEIAAFYAAYAQGREPDLVSPALQYGDYALWRERELAGETFAQDIRYWREQLAGELPVAALPADRPRPGQPSHRGGMETFALSGETTQALKALGRQAGVTFYVVLLAAFKALLHRYGGQEDIIVGGVTDMRRRPELTGIVGYFLNSIALRTRPTADMPFSEYLGQVQNTVLGALDASSVPFDRVVREVRPRRIVGAHPIFQVLFSIEPPPPAIDPGWDLTQMDVTVGVAKFDLYLELDERAHALIGRFLYSTDMFDASTIRQMIGHWKQLLAGIVADPECALGRLPLAPWQDRCEISNARSGPARVYPQTALPEWFDSVAARTPDAIAVECEGRRWRYRDLRERVVQLQARLERAGSGRDRLVGIMLDRGFDMVAGLLAILRSGAAYLPLDPALPPARLALLLGDARPALLLTQSAHARRLPESGPKAVLCDGAASGGSRAPPLRCTPDDLAYVLYTSGSTGNPKAVEISQHSLSNLLRAMADEIGPSAHDGWLAVTTLSFDIAALELFLPLVSGGRLLLATREDAGDPARLKRLLENSHCTIMQATPATWRGLLAAGWAGSPHLKILCGGESLPPELASQLLERGSAVWNMYGPTETTIWSLIHKVKPDDRPVPIGRPLANTTVHIMDARGDPVPKGVAGELWIGGAGVARGYRGDGAQTARKFRGSRESPAERLYRTGDLVRVRADGLLEFLGRADNQVKVRGFRVGLEEVEAAIAGHPDVVAAAVCAWPDGSGECALTGYVCPHSARPVSHAELTDFLEKRLPRYMIPSRWMTLETLPTTTSGKLDRARLPQPREATARASGRPRDSLEHTLAELWRGLLDVSDVGVNDNFFELGGHSLLAAMLASEIRKVLRRELPLASLFLAPTIAGQARLLRKMEQPAFSHLVSLREGTCRPLFIVHGVFGNVLQFRALAAQLKTARPICACQARGADLRQKPHATIDEMATAYLAEIRKVQPLGPYAIGGYSFGGLIAYEMACRLREGGENVELLALFETDVHSRNLLLGERLGHHWNLAGRVARKLMVLPVRAWRAYLFDKANMIRRHFLVPLESRDPIPPGRILPDDLLARNREMYKLCVREFARYRPRRFPGRISVFRAAEPIFDMYDPLPLWRRMADAVEVFTIEGNHGTIMDDGNVGGLAQQLGRCLAHIDSGAEARIGRDSPDRMRPQGPSFCSSERDLPGEPDFAH